MLNTHKSYYGKVANRGITVRSAVARWPTRCVLAPALSVERMVLAISLLLFSCSFSPVCAQDPDGQASDRGFHPNGSYSISNIETISLAGGNLTYSIPLASLPASRGGRLKPAVYLLYNSKLYDTGVKMCLGQSCQFKYTQTDLLKASRSGWTYGTNFNVLTTNRAVNYPEGPPPNLTHKYKTRIFFPDGSSHQIHPSGQTHNADYYSVSPGVPNSTRTYYSTDATYFRVQFSTDGASWTIYFSDGSTVNYDNPSEVQTTTDGNGNSYTVEEVLLQNGDRISYLTDQLGRKITIEKPVNGAHMVRVDGVGGTELVTTINWGTTSPQGKKWLWKVFHEDDPSIFKPGVPLQKVVTSINLPNGLSYQFQYNSDIFDPLNPTKSVGWGELYRTTMPTGAIVQYAYAMDNRHGNEIDDIIEPKYLLWDHPVSKRLQYTESYDGVNTEKEDIWTYAINILEGGPAEGQTSSGMVTGPDGGATSEYFEINSSGSTSFGKEGLTYKTVRPDSSVVERIWGENMPNNGSGTKKNFYVKTEFISIANAAVPPQLVMTAIRDYIYDKNGNLLQVAEYDWVPYGDVDRDVDGRPIGVPGSAASKLKRVIAHGFHNQTPTADLSAYSSHTYNQTTAPNLRSAAAWSEVRSNLSEASALSRAEFDYDDSSGKGNLTAQRSWDSTKGALARPLAAGTYIAVSHQYDTYGNRTDTTDGRGVRTQFVFDAINGFTNLYPTETRAAVDYPALKRTTTHEYDFSTGLVTRITDVDNNVSTATTYDVFGRPTLVKGAVDKPEEETRTRTEYDDTLRRVIVLSDLTTVGDEKLVAIQHYDQLGRVRLSRQLEDSSTQDATVETHGIKVQTRYTFNGSNSYTLTSNPYRAATSDAAASEATVGWSRTKADKAGRIIAVQTFSGAGLPAPWDTNAASTGTVTTAYDANLTTVTDQLEKQRKSSTDGLGRLIQIYEAPNDSNFNYLTSYAYGVLDDLTGVTQQMGTTTQSRTFVYDSLKRLTSATNPESGMISYQYDNNGNLIQKTDARVPAVTTTYIYDQLNRLTNRSYSDLVTPAVTYAYDGGTNGKGRLTSVGSSVSSYSYSSYDALGRVLVGTQTTEEQSYQISYSYDLAGNMKSQTYQSGRVVTSEFDSAGRLAGVVKNQATGDYYAGAAAGAANRIQYYAQGAIKDMKLGNGLWEHAVFNSRLQPTEIRLGTAQGGTDRLKLNYGYGTTDNNGNVRSQTITVPTVAGITGFTATQTYGYDSVNRLETAQESGTSWTQNFDYDRYGNRYFISGTTLPAQLDASNNPIIDPENNRIDIEASGQSSYSYDGAGNLKHDVAHAFAYDGENKQTSYDGGASLGGGASYYYDGDGRRVKKVVGGSPMNTTVFFYNIAGQLVAEYTSASPSGPGGTSYLTSDTLGSPRVVTGPNQEVRARHDYLPFGEELVAGYGGRTDTQGYVPDSVRQKFTGYERDAESGLDFAQARYYASAQGRFTSVDPLMASATIVNPQTWNRYSYVTNRPLSFIDPSGMMQAGCWDASCFGSDDNEGKSEAELEYVQGVRNTNEGNAARNALRRGNYARVAAILEANSYVGLAVGGARLWGEIGSAFIGGFAPYTQVASMGGGTIDGAIKRGWRAVAAKLAKLRGPDFQIFTASAGGGISKFAPVGEPLFDTIHGFSVGPDAGATYSVGWIMQLEKPSRLEVMDFGKGVDLSVGMYGGIGFTLIANLGFPPTQGVAFGFGIGKGTSVGIADTLSAYQEAERRWQRMIGLPWAK